MTHPLDRPVWNALTTRQAHLAEGGHRALRIGADFGLFAASRDLEPGSLAALAALIPPDGVVGILETSAIAVPPGAALAMRGDVHRDDGHADRGERTAFRCHRTGRCRR